MNRNCRRSLCLLLMQQWNGLHTKKKPSRDLEVVPFLCADWLNHVFQKDNYSLGFILYLIHWLPVMSVDSSLWKVQARPDNDFCWELVPLVLWVPFAWTQMTAQNTKYSVGWFCLGVFYIILTSTIFWFEVKSQVKSQARESSLSVWGETTSKSWKYINPKLL